MKKVLCASIVEMERFAREFISGFSPSKDRVTIVGLYGDLGSCKTAFVQQVAKMLGIQNSIQSPTFVIMRKYPIQNPPFIPPLVKGGKRGDFFLIHIDAYRLDSGADLEKLGWRELAADPRNLICIEWADRVADILPFGHAKLHFRFVNETTREIGVE